MIERHDDLWAFHRVPGHLVFISTNGFVKRNGCAVMGRGCALQATRIHSEIAKALGTYIKENGNTPGVLVLGKAMLGILPVKHNWWEKADLELIQRCVDYLAIPSNLTFHVPRLGCGNGQRDWVTEVRPLMIGLSDSVVVHS